MPAGFKIAEAYVAVVPRGPDFKVGLRAIVEEAAADVKADVGVGLRHEAPESLRADLDVAVLLATEGLNADVGMGLRNDAVGELDADVKAGVQLVEDNNKIKVKVDPKAAQQAGQQGGSLIMAAIAAGVAFGPALILTGAGVVVAGLGALLTKSNADIQAEFKTVSSDISADLTGAVQPLVPAVQAAMVQLDNSVHAASPQIKALFTDAQPDLGAFTSGVTGLATHTLPGLTTAINQSRGIVSGFTGELPVLGDGIGKMFTGMTTNAQSTGRGIVDFVDVTSNALGTLGHVVGSASADLSTAFSAVTPILNGTLGAIDKFASPGTVGAVLGVFGAMKLDPAVSSGLQSVSNGLVSVAAKAEGSSGMLGKLSGAAAASAGGLGKAADMMAGPFGLAVGAGIGLLAGLVSSMHQTIATAADFTAAVAQDNGVVGANTTAIIQQKLAKVDLSAAQKDLGVSQATLIEYAAGEKNAQQEVTAAYNAKTAALGKTAGATEEYSKNGIVFSNNASQQEINTLARAKSQIDQVTKAVAEAIKQQNQQNQAYLAATKSGDIFTGMVESAATALQTQATQAGIGTVAALQLGDAQDRIATKLSSLVYDYQLAAASGQAYGGVLQALNGTSSSLADAQNTLAQDMLNAKTSFKANGESLDKNTQAGINNRQALSQASKAIIQLGVDQYQATGNIDVANHTIQDQINAFVKSTGATGKAKDAIVAYLEQITKIPPSVTTDVHANTAPARQALNGLMQSINSSTGTVQIYATTKNPSGGKALGANARGGDVGAGDASVVGEEGPEIVVFGAAGRVIPNDQIRTVGSTGGHSAVSTPGALTIQNLTVPITGIVDLTDPNSMTAAARRMVVNLSNALIQVQQGRTGAIY